jgi:muconate cycloisomerase
LSQLVPEDQEHDDANSIKDTVDFALHDLVGRCLGVPVGVLLGGRNRTSVDGMPVIHVDTPRGMAEHALEQHQRYGFRYFKLKPIGEPEADVETLALMREKMGPAVKYYMDANYALKVKDPDEVARYMNRLAPYGLEVYEDPLDADFAVYRYIRERTKVKLMIDEKARTPKAIMDIIRERCADQINIHANWSGGFHPALRKAELAVLGGMATMIGSTSYMGPGAAAYQILSAQLPLETPCEQTFCEEDVNECSSIIKEPFPCCDGRYYIPDRPGLGVEINLEAVERLTMRKVELG